MSENNAADKLVGSQYLDLATLKKNVADANKQLNTIGKNIKFDFSKQIADEIKKSVEQAANNLNVSLPVSNSSSTKLNISELEKQEKVQIRAYTTLTKQKKSMLTSDDPTSSNYLQQGVDTVEQLIKKNDILIAQRKTEAGYAKSMATITEARLRSEKAVAQTRTKISAKPEEEVLSILKEQIRIKDEIFKIDKQLISASEEETVSLNARKDVQKQTDSILEDNKNTIVSKNAELQKSTEIQNLENKNLEKEISNRQTISKLQKKQLEQEKSYSKTTETVQKALTTLVTVYAANALKNFWKDSLNYAQKYYDKLNEIQIVTSMTDDEAAKLGESYRNMAREMSVSSAEIATAATEFWRQGLGDSDVNARLRDTTMYAKISGLAFDEAAELVTAATNSMELDSRRVVDVFAYLGKQHCPMAA